MDKANDIADALTAIIRLMVDEPDKLQVLVEPNGQGYTLKINPSPTDLGKIIGKMGRTARSIRTLVSAITMAQQMPRVTVDIADSSPISDG